MKVQIRASNGLYWVVTPAGGVAAAASREGAATFELGGPSADACYLQELPSGRYITALRGGGGELTNAFIAPSLDGSAYAVLGGAVAWESTICLRTSDRAHFLTLGPGNAIVATATAIGPQERFTLFAPVIPAGKPTLPGSEEVGSAVAGGELLTVAAGWRRCRRCGIFYDGTVPPASAACAAAVVGRPVRVRAGAARPQSHTPDGDAVYGVLHAENRNVSELQAFRRCNACAGMILMGLHSGVCASGRGDHSYAASAGYAPLVDHAFDPQRSPSRWYACAKCRCLFHGDATEAPCTGGGNHERGESPPYTVRSL